MGSKSVRFRYTGRPVLLFKDQVDGAYQQDEGGHVVPFEGNIFEKDQGENHENDEGDHFLDHFQLDKIKGSALFLESDPVSRNLEAVFKKSHPPAEEDDPEQRRMPGAV